MILDDRSRFSVAQDLTGAVAGTSTEATNHMPVGSVLRDLGAGHQLFVVSRVTTAFASATSAATLQINVMIDNPLFPSPILLGASHPHLVANAIPLPELAANTVIPIALSPLSTSLVTRLRASIGLGLIYSKLIVAYTVEVENLTAGAITTYMTNDPFSAMRSESYADAVP